MSVAQAQREIDSQEFTDWLAYDRLDPFGEDRADLRSATVAATIANANRGRHTKAFTVADFMPTFEKPKPQTAAEIMSHLFTFAEAHNAAIGKKP